MNGYQNNTALNREIDNENVSEDSDFERDPMFNQALAMFQRARIGNDIHFFWLPFLSPIGLVGNTIIFLVMLKPHNRRISCCVFMAALAVSDMVLCVFAGYYWLVTISGEIRNIDSNEGCKSMSWIYHAFSNTGIWLITLMTIDRFIAVRFPLRSLSLCSAKKARWASVACFLIFLAYTFPYYLYSVKLKKSYCIALYTTGIYVTVYSYLSLAVSSVIPFSIILVCNCLIIHTVRKRRKYFCKDNAECNVENNDKINETDKTKRVKTRESQLVIMLLLVAFALLVLTLPQYVRYAVYLIVDNRSSVEAYATYLLLYNLTQKLFFTNSMCNFFLYAIGGSKFRQDVKNLFCNCCSNKEDLNGVTSFVSS